MASISKRLEQIISKELSKTIIPVKTEEGILVGNILIKSRDNLKYLYRNGDLIYGDIFLNQTAIALANILARSNYDPRADQIYRADKDYSKHFIDSQLLRANYEKSKKNKDFDRADMFWARYEQARDRTKSAKSRVESLSKL
jgi:hypothetical protein